MTPEQIQQLEAFYDTELGLGEQKAACYDEVEALNVAGNRKRSGDA